MDDERHPHHVVVGGGVHRYMYRYIVVVCSRERGSVRVNPVFVYIVMSTPGAMLALESMAGLHDGPRTYRFLTLPLFTTYLHIIYLLKSVALGLTSVRNPGQWF